MMRGKRKKRSNGEGTIYQRPDGRWAAQITIGYDPSTGKPKRQTFYGKTWTEVNEKITKARYEQQIGAFIEPNKITLGEWLATWLESYKKMKVRPTTYENYEYIIRVHIKPNIGFIPLRQLQASDLQRFFAKMLKEGRKAQYKKEAQQTSLSRRTVELTRTIIKAALTQAVKEQLIARNPADATELPPADEEKEVIPFTQEEALKFLNSIKGKRLFAAYYLCLATGLRRGELLGLKWEDIDFKNGNFEIKRSLVEVKNETGKYVLEFQKPKTRKSQRTIPLTEDIIKVLKAHKVKQNEEKLFFGKGYQDNGLVFCSEDGRPLWPRNFHRQYSKLLKAAGIPHKKPHAMRHTFVSLLLEQGEDLKNIQELVGHASIVVTANVYGKIAEKTKKKAVEKMSQILKIEAVNR